MDAVTIQLIVASGGFVGLFLVLFRFGKIEQQIENLGRGITEIKTNVKSIDRGRTELCIQITILERQVEERTRI